MFSHAIVIQWDNLAKFSGVSLGGVVSVAKVE